MRQRIRKAAGMISFLLLPVTLYFFSPVLSVYAASQGMLIGSSIVFMLLFIFSLVFGRAYCGFVCPTGALQEWCFAVNAKPAGKKVNRIKYLIWAPWLGSIIVFYFLAGGIKKVDPLFLTASGVSVSEPWVYSIYYSIVALFLVCSFILGKRAGCHTFCWMAPFMIIGTKLKNFLHIPSLCLKTFPDKCLNCKTCIEVCPMSLEVDRLVKTGRIEDNECILCGECADGCVRKAIKYSFGAGYKQE